MKKSMLTLAVVAASLPTLAMADATLYGSFRMMMEKEDQKSMLLKDNSSRIGLRGSVDLGLEDTQGIYLWEQALDLNKGILDGGRYAWVGASGNWGTLKGGKQDHAFHSLVNGYTEVLSSNSASYDSVQLREYSRRQGNTLQYASPNFNGVQVVIDGLFQGDAGSAPGVKDKQVDGYGLGIKYDANGFYGALAYTAFKNGKANNGSYKIDQDAWGIAAGYKVDSLNIRANYARLEDDQGGSKALKEIGKATLTSLAATYDIGNTQLQLEHGQRKNDYTNVAKSDQKGQFTGVGVTHKLGKGRVYAEYYDYNKELYASTGDKFLVGYRLDF